MCARVHKTAADGHPDSNDNVGNVKNQNNNRDCQADMTMTDVEVAKDIRSTKHSWGDGETHEEASLKVKRNKN